MLVGLWVHDYRIMAVNLNRQKEWDAVLRTIQEMQFVVQSKNADGVNADGAQFMFALTILKKVKETRLNSLKRV